MQECLQSAEVAWGGDLSLNAKVFDIHQPGDIAVSDIEP
jgi:hypothetical protein